MTHRIYCDECNDYGYLFIDGDSVEVISTCQCPNLLMSGENL